MDRFRVLNLRRLRERKLRTLASLLGIASGVALVVAMLSLLTSVNATAESTVDLLGGAQVEIVTAQPLPASTITAIEDIEGVESVRRFVQTPMLINGEFGWLVAIDPSSQLTTATSRALAEVSGVAVGPAFATAPIARLTAADGSTVEADGSQRVPEVLNRMYGGKFIASDVDTALKLRSPEGSPIPLSILVYAQGDAKIDAEQVQREVGGVGRVESVDSRVIRARRVFQVLFSSLSMMGSMGLVVGGFLLFNTMNMAVLDRRHEIAALRALGSDRRSIWLGLLGEAFLLGAIGSALGLLLGSVIARGVVSTIPDAFARSIGSPLRVSVPALLLVPAWIVGVLTSLVASIGPLRRTLGIQPIEALRPDEVNADDSRVSLHPIVIGLGLACLAVVAFAPDTLVPAVLTIGLAVVVVLLLSYGFAQPISLLVCALARRLGKSGELAALSLQRSPRRVWATTAMVLVSIAIAVASTGTSTNVRATSRSDLNVLELSDYWLGTTSGDNIGLVALPAEWKEKIAEIPGVRAVAGSRWSPITQDDHSVGLLGIDGDSSYSFYRLADDEARAKMRAGEGVIALRQYLTTFDLELGDVIDLPGANPPLQLPIVGVTDGLVATSGGLISISMELYTRHYGISGVSFYEAQLQPSADRAAVGTALETLAKTASFPVQVNSGKAFMATAAKAGDQVLSLIAMVLLVITICAGIALLNTLLASVLERTREVAVLRAIGATQKQLVRSVVVEALAIGLTGGFLGAVAGTLLHLVMLARIAELTNFHIVRSFSPVTLVLAALSGVMIALVGSSLPARRVARLDLLGSLSQ